MMQVAPRSRRSGEGGGDAGGDGKAAEAEKDE